MGHKLVAHGLVTIKNDRKGLSDLTTADTAEAGINGADTACVCTSWPAYVDLDDEFNATATPTVVNDRRIIERPDKMVYEGLS